MEQNQGNTELLSVCDVCIMRVSFIMLNHSMMSSRSYLLNCGIKTTELLVIHFNSDSYIFLKQSIVKDTFPIPSNAEHQLKRMGTGDQLLLGQLLLC